MKIYTKKDMLQALKDAGLPSTYLTLQHYEAKGIIDRSDRMTNRSYTLEEIRENVERVRLAKITKYKKRIKK